MIRAGRSLYKLQLRMFIIFWLIFYHSYDEKFVPVSIIHFMLQSSSKPYMQASDQAYVSTVDNSIWRLLELH
ncbi:hypothetical protein ES332_D07G188700v1 [Gossypium tomentosum]|uniref:Uncharacterized protein n=1 Tax=Gossypium tomentosum TaxID=34277 RepID=A0A5D2K8A1_GOSTO|nr:hypothetical protein ES332_D07G188700v1 [Gossypium tomentosum]TYH63389.1 hypothetical protein ES332_D07G188700v1 [Gossypium tomentosum]